LVIGLLLMSQVHPARAEGLSVDADFPGGNVVLDKVEGDAVFVHQDLRDTAGDWFFWHFRVRGAAGRKLTFQFTKGDVVGVLGPAVSTDGGGSWAWLGKASLRGASGFRYAFAPDSADVRFCFAVPYYGADLARFLQRHAASPHLRAETLCKSKKGRDVEFLRFGRIDGLPDHRVVITCRHHGCESMASYSLEGIVEAVLGETEDGAWLRQRVEFLAVPFVDKDGVEDGDQGKNRRPHDHNRDYAGESLYPEAKAIRELVPKWSEGRLRVALDLHCPHIRGPHNEVIYLVGSESPATWQQQCEFGRILEAVRTGPLPYRAQDNLPFGHAWNTAANYGVGRSFGRWAGELPGVRLSTAIEIPYANASGCVVTAESARAFGHDLAKALRRYLAP
jgi:hypothetical protein